jgi:hypothetical protein
MRAADDDTPSQPENSATLCTLLPKTLAQVGTLVAERDALVGQNERLQHLLLKLKCRQFGTKSERLPEEQLLFAFEEIEATLAGNAAEAGKASPTLRDNQAKRRRAGRGRLPAHLPRIEVDQQEYSTRASKLRLPTFRFCFGIWWRRSWFSLNGKVGIRRSEKGDPPTSTRPAAPLAGIHATVPSRLDILSAGNAPAHDSENRRKESQLSS